MPLCAVVGLVCLAALGGSLEAAPQTSPDVARLIREAGNAQDETVRYARLKQLETLPELDPALRSDLAKLLPVVDDWANGKARVVADASRAAENGYLCRFIGGKVQPSGTAPIHPPELSPESPLYPIWCYYRARMLLWRVIQSGPLLRVPASRDTYYGEARRLLEVTRKAFPENRVVRMYLGEPIPWPNARPAVPEAPQWASLQREGLEKLTDIIHWWIDERQLADGQFGGGWGDDVEMWRWWTPVLVAFDDPKANAAQERISSGMFRQPHMKAGFTARVTDVEHSNEDTTDTILPMMHLKPDDPVWQQRALHLAELMRDRWTGRNERGFLQFKSVYFSVDKVDASAARAFDTVYHPSIVQPALLLWQRTGNPDLGKLFGNWLKLWVDAAARADNGKPAGVLPSALRWPEGAVGKPDLPWWEPFSPGHNDALYNWPGATKLMTSTLLLANHLLGDARYLEPIRSMAAIRLRHLDTPRGSDASAGSEAWCARQMSSFLPDTLAKYRFLTGDKQYDRLLLKDASGYIQYRLKNDEPSLVKALDHCAEAFRSNWEGYTAEMRWTDRVMSFTHNYLQYLSEPAPPTPTPEILYSTATGDPGNPLVFPLNAVSWLTPPRDIAALVTDSRRDGFEAQLFHFGDRPRAMGAEFYLLQPGQYEFTLASQGSGRIISQQTVKREGPRTRVSFELPAKESCQIRVQLKGN